MSRRCVDTVIIGQGLAGTTLAWQLAWAGESVGLIDEPAPHTSSRIAAGLMTPITGQRLVPSWRFLEFWSKAVAFYRRVEAETGSRFFHEIPMVRLFKSEQERERLSKASAAEFAHLLHHPEPLVSAEDFANPWGGFEMSGGRLDVPEYLAASQEWFAEAGAYQSGRVQLPEDLEIHAEGITLSRWGLEAKRVIFCQGFAARANPWFRKVPFDPAKGEILTIRIPNLTERRVIHRGIWLSPLAEDIFRAGATYDREHLDNLPTPNGGEEICDQLRQFLKRPFEVLDHHAAVRPIVLGRHPVAGLHPHVPRLGYFNGLGSKGSLQAPLVAEQFANFLTGRGGMDRELDLQRRYGDAIWND